MMIRIWKTIPEDISNRPLNRIETYYVIRIEGIAPSICIVGVFGVQQDFDTNWFYTT